jgi:hypothetical protein
LIGKRALEQPVNMARSLVPTIKPYRNSAELTARFLNQWVVKNVHASTFPTKREEGQVFADQCIADGARVGIGREDLESAAGGDLVGYMFEAMDGATIGATLRKWTWLAGC